MRPLFISRHLPASLSTWVRAVAGVACALGSGFATAQSILSWDPPFKAAQPVVVEHVPAQPARKPWVICVLVPHVKDAYWLGVNHGVAEEAERLRVEMRMAEAGGYDQLAVQRQQIRDCASDPGVHALVIGAVSRDVLTPELRRVTARMPVVATVNAINDAGVDGKVGVDWDEMGRAAGAFLVQQVSPQGPEVPVAWFPGPRSVSQGVDHQFRQAIAGSRIALRATAWGDTGKATQRNLLQQVLDDHPEVRYVVGNALMAEAAISVLRERGLQGRIDVISTYLTPAVLRGLVRGRILAASTDAPVLQGRMSLGLAVDLLEKRQTRRHIAPIIKTLSTSDMQSIETADSLPPPLMAPRFVVHPPSSN